jgi:hypothetical protein
MKAPVFLHPNIQLQHAMLPPLQHCHQQGNVWIPMQHVSVLIVHHHCNTPNQGPMPMWPTFLSFMMTCPPCQDILLPLVIQPIVYYQMKMMNL